LIRIALAFSTPTPHGAPTVLRSHVMHGREVSGFCTRAHNSCMAMYCGGSGCAVSHVDSGGPLPCGTTGL